MLIILHQDNRIFMRFPNGASCQFDYRYAFVPIVIGFLAAIIWNLLVASGAKKHLQSTSLPHQPTSALATRTTRSLLEHVLVIVIVAVIVALLLLILFALTWHK